MITQTNNQQYLLQDVRSLGSSDVFQRAPLYNLRVSAKLWGGAQGQSATIIVYGGKTASPGIPLATIILTENDNEEAFTISSDYEFIRAEVTKIITTRPGSVTVTANAVEDI